VWSPCASRFDRDCYYRLLMMRIRHDALSELLASIGQFFRWLLFGAVVDYIAAPFTAAVLSHPAVKEAATATLVDGMNRFLTQPDLDELLLHVNDSVSKTQGKEPKNGSCFVTPNYCEDFDPHTPGICLPFSPHVGDIARQAGQDFPKMVRHFVSGMMNMNSTKDVAEEGEAKKDAYLAAGDRPCASEPLTAASGAEARHLRRRSASASPPPPPSRSLRRGSKTLSESLRRRRFAGGEP